MVGINHDAFYYVVGLINVIMHPYPVWRCGCSPPGKVGWFMALWPHMVSAKKVETFKLNTLLINIYLVISP
jgi:hypothetical protein